MGVTGVKKKRKKAVTNNNTCQKQVPQATCHCRYILSCLSVFRFFKLLEHKKKLKPCKSNKKQTNKITTTLALSTQNNSNINTRYVQYPTINATNHCKKGPRDNFSHAQRPHATLQCVTPINILSSILSIHLCSPSPTVLSWLKTRPERAWGSRQRNNAQVTPAKIQHGAS